MDQANQLIVSVSGVRGLIGRGLSAGVAGAFASALGSYLGGKKVVLSRDGRPSGMMLRHAVLAGLLETGCEVEDLGIASTPTCGIAVRRLRAAGGIQITASHNPAPWNGLKLFGSDGRVLPAAEGQRVKMVYESGAFQRAEWDKVGSVQDRRQAEDWHRDRVLEVVDVTRIRARGLRVFLDANGGAGGPLGRKLLDAFQCRTVSQGADADGFFLHEPEPVAANLVSVLPRVTECGADVGFVLDPDADRLALIDEQGHFLGEEMTLALAVDFRLERERGPVVINMSTSRVVEEVCRRFRVPCYRSAVGEANVADRMIREGAVIGGEGNGGVMDPRVGYVRDPFIAMGLLLNFMAETGRPLSELAAQLPTYHIVKGKSGLPPEKLESAYQRLAARWPHAKINREDGLRLDWDEGWLHVRPSNTEPIVRVIAEAADRQQAEVLCQEAIRVASA
jgi:phosphomannomutase